LASARTMAAGLASPSPVMAQGGNEKWTAAAAARPTRPNPGGLQGGLSSQQLIAPVRHWLRTAKTNANVQCATPPRPKRPSEAMRVHWWPGIQAYLSMDTRPEWWPRWSKRPTPFYYPHHAIL